MRHLSALAGFCLIGCASNLARSNPPTARDVSEASVVRSDEFLKSSALHGPPFWLGNEYALSLMKVVTKQGNPYLHISAFPREWAFFEEARDLDGKVYKLHNVDHKVERGYVHESFMIELPRERLNAANADGLTMRLYGKRRQFTFTLPGYYIQGWLDRLDALAKPEGTESKGK